MESFFDKYDRFYKTSNTSPLPHRLNGRYEAIINRNIDLFRDKRVLDIASHDGRWTFAALKADADQVVGVEPRADLLRHAQETLDAYGTDQRRYKFFNADIFDWLDSAQKFDVVLCLGFFYHTIRHVELIHRIDQTDAKFVVIDTEIAHQSKNTSDAEIPPQTTRTHLHNVAIHLMHDPVENQSMAYADNFTRASRTIVGRPSRAAVHFIGQHFGFDSTNFDWPAHFQKYPHHRASMADYCDGWRETFYFQK